MLYKHVLKPYQKYTSKICIYHKPNHYSSKKFDSKKPEKPVFCFIRKKNVLKRNRERKWEVCLLKESGSGWEAEEGEQVPGLQTEPDGVRRLPHECASSGRQWLRCQRPLQQDHLGQRYVISSKVTFCHD